VSWLYTAGTQDSPYINITVSYRRTQQQARGHADAQRITVKKYIARFYDYQKYSDFSRK